MQNAPGAERARLPDIGDVAPRETSDPDEQQDQYRQAQPPGADGWAQFRHPPCPEGRSEHPGEQPAETDGCQPQAGLGEVVAEQHRHGEEAGERQQVQMPGPPRAMPVEQPEDKAGRPRYGDEQRMQREHAADDRRGEPAAALRGEPMTDRHQRGQHPQPADEHEHEQASDRPIQPPDRARAVAGRPLSCVPHVCPVGVTAHDRRPVRLREPHQGFHAVIVTGPVWRPRVLPAGCPAGRAGCPAIGPGTGTATWRGWQAPARRRWPGRRAGSPAPRARRRPVPASRARRRGR